MSLSKIVGMIVGAVLGLAIAALYVTSGGRSFPASATVATILFGAFLGSGLGAFIGSADR